MENIFLSERLNMSGFFLKKRYFRHV